MTGFAQAIMEQCTPSDLAYADFLRAELRSRFEGLSVATRHELARSLIDEAWDKRLSDKSKPPVPCASGVHCSGCCLHQTEVDTSPWELRKLLDRVQAEGRLFQVVSRAKKVSANGGGACPLLGGDGMCTVYDIRPLSCRAYHSMDRTACMSWAKAEIPMDSKFWLETHLIAGQGLIPPQQMRRGAHAIKHRLFECLAKFGQQRLARASRTKGRR